MPLYKAPKRSYFELLELFKKEIVENPGKTEDDMTRKYFALVSLTSDVKANFQDYYEYALLKNVLQDYTDVLTKQRSPVNRKVHVFTPSETSVTDSDNIVYNTPSRSTARVRRFGEVQINPSRLIRTDVFDQLKEDQFGIKFRIQDYSLHDNNTMYQLTHSFFIGDGDTQFMLDFYLQDLRLKYYYTYTDKSDRFQLFDLDDATLTFGFNYDKSSLQYY